MSYEDLGYDSFMVNDLDLPTRKSETQMAAEAQDRSISMNILTVGRLTGGTIQTHNTDNVGIKIIGATGMDVYGVSVRWLDSSANVGGLITAITNGGLQIYSTTGDVKIDSGSNQLRLVYDSMRWDITPTAQVNTATHYVTVNMNGADYKLLLKSV